MMKVIYKTASIFGFFIHAQGLLDAGFTDVCPDNNTSASIINSIPISNTNVTSMFFSVKSCSDVSLILTANASTREPYIKITIEEELTNKTVSIKNCDFYDCNEMFMSTTVHFTSYLNCETFKMFWVSWNGNGNISVGEGLNVSLNVILIHDAGLQFDINYIGIKSSNRSGNDMWKFKLGVSSFNLRDAVRCNYSQVFETNLGTSSGNLVTPLPISSPTTIITKESSCECACPNSNNRWSHLDKLNLTTADLRKELADHLKNLTNAISVNKKETKRFLLTKISARDDRASSNSIGWVGIFIMSFVPVVIIITDFMSCGRNKRNIDRSSVETKV